MKLLTSVQSILVSIFRLGLSRLLAGTYGATFSTAANVVSHWNDRRSRRVFLCFYSAIFQLTSAKFQTFAYNSRMVGSSYMKF